MSCAVVKHINTTLKPLWGVSHVMMSGQGQISVSHPYCRQVQSRVVSVAFRILHHAFFRWNGFCSIALAFFSLFVLLVLSWSALPYPRIAHMASPLDRYSVLADSTSTSLDRTEPGAFTNILCLCVIDQAIIMGLGAVRDSYPIDSICPVLEFRC